MSNIIKPDSAISVIANQTMSTKEIAELTDKRHDHVLRDAKKMLQDLDLFDPSKMRTEQYQTLTNSSKQTKEILLIISN